MRFLLTCTLLICSTAVLNAADKPSASADEAFAASDWPHVIALYGEQTKANPSDAKAWYRLGRGLEETNRFTEAQDAFTHAAQLKYPIPTVWVHVAANAAAAGRTDQALQTLESMAANGFSFPKLILDDDRFAPLKSDSRFTAALQKIDLNGSPCKDPAHPEYRQLDFWVGEWSVFDRQAGYPVGESSVQKIINDCVIFENWSGWLGRTGKSFNKYDANTKQWEQYWVDESPTRGFYQGHFEQDRMLYAGEFTTPKGQHTLTKLTFFNQPDGTVRQLSEQSTDEGKSWQVNYDFVYRRKQ